MNRRSFLGALGVFSILPGAGRVWRAVRQVQPPWIMIGTLPDNVNDMERFALGCVMNPPPTHAVFMRYRNDCIPFFELETRRIEPHEVEQAIKLRNRSTYDYLHLRKWPEQARGPIEVRPEFHVQTQADEEKNLTVQDVDRKLQHASGSRMFELSVLESPSGQSDLRILPPKPAAVPWSQHGLA